MLHHRGEQHTHARGKPRSVRHGVFATGEAGKALLVEHELRAAFGKQFAEKACMIIVRMGQKDVLNSINRDQLVELSFICRVSARIAGIQRDPTLRCFKQILPEHVVANLVDANSLCHNGSLNSAELA